MTQPFYWKNIEIFIAENVSRKLNEMESLKWRLKMLKNIKSKPIIVDLINYTEKFEF